jgi:ferredoxin
MATRIVIEVSRSRRDGFGNCAIAAADIFDLDDEGNVCPTQTSVDATRLEAERRTAYDRPVTVIACKEIE